MQGKKSYEEQVISDICDFFKKDNLGKLCNMHMALCDKKGAQGP